MKAIMVTGAAGVDPEILRAATERATGAGVVVHARDEEEAAGHFAAAAGEMPDALDALLCMPRVHNTDIVIREMSRSDMSWLDIPMWKRQQIHPTSPKRRRR